MSKLTKKQKQYIKTFNLDKQYRKNLKAIFSDFNDFKASEKLFNECENSSNSFTFENLKDLTEPLPPHGNFFSVFNGKSYESEEINRLVTQAEQNEKDANFKETVTNMSRLYSPKLVEELVDFASKKPEAKYTEEDMKKMYSEGVLTGVTNPFISTEKVIFSFNHFLQHINQK